MGDASVVSILHFGKEAYKVCICLFTLPFLPFWCDRHLLNQSWGATWTKGKPTLETSDSSWLSRSWLSGYRRQTRSKVLMQHMKIKLHEHGGYPGKHFSQLLFTEVSCSSEKTPVKLLIILLLKHGRSAHRHARKGLPWRHPLWHKNALRQVQEKVLDCMQHEQHRDGWGHVLRQGRLCKVMSSNTCNTIKGALISLIWNQKMAPIWCHFSKDYARTKGPSISPHWVSSFFLQV